MTEESIDAIQVIGATIRNYQKSQLKFVAGSAQFTLLKNRLHALEVGRDLLNGRTDITVEALVEAQAPIESIIHKTEKALSNQKKTSPVIKRMTLLLAAMTAVQTAIINQLSAKKPTH